MRFVLEINLKVEIKYYTIKYKCRLNNIYILIVTKENKNEYLFDQIQPLLRKKDLENPKRNFE